MRRSFAFVSVAALAAVVFAAAVFRNDIAQATSLAPPPNAPGPGVAIPGKAVLVADDLVVLPDTNVSTPWVDTSACQRLVLAVRGIRAALVEFYTSMDGAMADTWWTDDTEDNFNFIPPQAGGAIATAAWTFSFSFHGLQPAAAPNARVQFFAPDNEPAQTVDKAWIYCVG